MSPEIKKRIFISLVVVAMFWLYAAGINIQVGLNELRSTALNQCIDGKLGLFDYCYKKTNLEITASLFQHAIPFLPAALLLWIHWLLKIDSVIDTDSYPVVVLKWLRVVGYLFGALGVFLPFLIVLEKSAERIYEVQWSNLFIAPMIASAWICAPLLFQRLVGSNSFDADFIRLRQTLYVVLASPILAFLVLMGRDLLKI